MGVELGPQSFMRQDHEKVLIASPQAMLVIPPGHYAKIANPYVRQEGSKEPARDSHGQVQVRHGDSEFRFSDEWSEPFALQPGESLVGTITPLTIVEVITNIDIQNVEPVDERTRESLQKSVQLAIEITTKKQERNARHEAEGIEQEAKGKIERRRRPASRRTLACTSSRAARRKTFDSGMPWRNSSWPGRPSWPKLRPPSL